MEETGIISYRRFLVPVLLGVGWIVGCVMMIYVVFS
ncbi:sarcoplasmic/endoplasmic reticulum calcium ATPase regulator DWORF-like [Xenopus laevis]|uniref:Sarcoplasmic/endoplasmic reticulum calcium ATPase regulator DWORF-like n=1 Tax=Xenopus laevis TaxID=8355 RepID=A0A8J1KLX3_XENLA|nr:sarcoplasmic/endoplasmic reticulum calcium ATPase regulator DWORF-like [Xenopus laevis]